MSRVADSTGIEPEVMSMEQQAFLPAPALPLVAFNALDPTADVIEFDAPIDILNTDIIGFGFNSDTITLDTNDLDGGACWCSDYTQWY